MHITHINLSKGLRGGERQTALLIQGLAAKQTKQQLIARYDSPLINILKATPNLNIIPIRKPYIWQLRHKLQTDLLHAHEAKAAQWCYLHHLMYRKPYVITRRVPHKPKANWFTRRVYNHAAAVVALSSAIKNIVQHYSPELQVEIIPSMYQKTMPNKERVKQLKDYCQQTYGKRTTIGNLIVGHIGALVDHHKGQSLIIEAARQLEHSHPQLLFIFVSDGPDKARLTKLAKGLPVYFAGHQSQVADYFALFDYFVFPSLHEGLGSSLLDAIFHQLPIIASRVDGIPDIIQDQQTGLLIEPGKADQLAKALIRIMDSDLSNKLVKQANLTLERYGVETVTEQYIGVYQRVVAGQKT